MAFKWQRMAQNSTKVKSPLANFIPERVEKPPLPVSQQEIEKLNNDIKAIVGGRGTEFNPNQLSTASAKLVELLLLYDSYIGPSGRPGYKKLQAPFRRPGYEKLRPPIAAALLDQMPDELLARKSFMPDYLKKAKLFINRYLTPDDLQHNLQQLIETTASCDSKLDRMMLIYSLLRKDNDDKSKFDERQQAIIRTAVGQLRFMTDVEHREGSDSYDAYLTKLAETFEIPKDKLAGFVHNDYAMKGHLNY